MEFKAHDYQNFAIQHIMDHTGAGLLLDMGLGKTVSALTAAERLIYEELEIDKVLVIAPKKVAENTWTNEASKWDHLCHLRIAKVLGTEKQRKEALKENADIYVINRENVAWLVGYYRSAFPFDMVIIDELSSFKSPKAIRFKALRMVRPLVKRVVGLTGTPTPRSLVDLWAQLYLLDMGERLGKTVTGYREHYFIPGRSNGHVVFDYKLQNGSEQAIYDRISDICISMKAEDYLTLPERIDRTVELALPDSVKAKYDEFEREQILALEDADEISAINAAALSNKLLQFANGAVYDADRNYHEVHREKLEALEEIVDTANGQPVLVFYNFKHDLERIMKHLKAYKPQTLATPEDEKRWNDGKIQVLLAHPASVGYGLNLQDGGNIIVWYGLNWSLELYLQANARLHRQGQKRPVIIHRLVVSGTMDEDVVKSLEGKAECQDALMNAVKARIRKYKK